MKRAIGLLALVVPLGLAVPATAQDLPPEPGAFLRWVMEHLSLLQGGDEGIINQDNAEQFIDFPPVAEAGPDRSVKIGDATRLDASGSSDRNGDTIDAHDWRLIEAPEGSATALAEAETATPQLIPDLPGLYVFELRVQSGYYRSHPDRVTVVAHPVTGHLPPFLDPIGGQSVYPGVTRRLQLEAQDYNGFSLAYLAEPLPLPAGASLNTESGLFTYRPQADQLGGFGLTFTVDNGDRSVSETVAFSVTELPPDPGNAGKATLEGIDSDGDGLRDDVQRYIALTFPDSAQIRAAVRQEARALQETLLSADDKEASMTSASKLMRSGECLSYLDRQGKIYWPDVAKELKAQVVNTWRRKRAWAAHGRNLAGEIFRSVPIGHRRATCELDPERLPN